MEKKISENCTAYILILAIFLRKYNYSYFLKRKKEKKIFLKFWLFYFKVKCSWEFLVFYLCSHIFVFVFKIVPTECYNAVFQLQVAILEVYLVITFSCHNERWKWFIWIYNSAKKKKKNANTMESIETIHLLDDG